MLDENKKWGRLWGIGVGPGDAEWLTLKALRIIQAVPVVALPQNVRGGPGIAYGIIREYLQPAQKVLPLALPFVLDEEILQKAWHVAVEQLIPWLEQGQDVAFLAEGDISFYSTFTYIARTLQAQAPWVAIESIPGICSPLAAAGVLHTPLAIGHEKTVILPALFTLDELGHALDWAEVVVLLKLTSVFAQVWQLLKSKNLLEHASLVEWVGSPQQKIFPNLLDLADYKPPYFSILIVRRYPYVF